MDKVWIIAKRSAECICNGEKGEKEGGIKLEIFQYVIVDIKPKPNEL